MKLVDQTTCDKMAGDMMPVRRNMSTFDGDIYQCACGEKHSFSSYKMNIIGEGMNGKFIVACYSKPQFLSLIKAKMKFGLIYAGLEYLAGYDVED